MILATTWVLLKAPIASSRPPVYISDPKTPRKGAFLHSTLDHYYSHSHHTLFTSQSGPASSHWWQATRNTHLALPLPTIVTSKSIRTKYLIGPPSPTPSKCKTANNLNTLHKTRTGPTPGLQQALAHLASTFIHGQKTILLHQRLREKIAP